MNIFRIFTNFFYVILRIIVQQGNGIVTTLEHLKYAFLTDFGRDTNSSQINNFNGIFKKSFGDSYLPLSQDAEKPENQRYFYTNQELKYKYAGQTISYGSYPQYVMFDILEHLNSNQSENDFFYPKTVMLTNMMRYISNNSDENVKYAQANFETLYFAQMIANPDKLGEIYRMCKKLEERCNLQSGGKRHLGRKRKSQLGGKRKKAKTKLGKLKLKKSLDPNKNYLFGDDKTQVRKKNYRRHEIRKRYSQKKLGY